MPYKLYLVQRLDEVDYDEYDSFVVSAADESMARDTHPGMNIANNHLKPLDITANEHAWKSNYGWIGRIDRHSDLLIKEIGTSKTDEHKVLCASFNAG